MKIRSLFIITFVISATAHIRGADKQGLPNVVGKPTQASLQQEAEIKEQSYGDRLLFESLDDLSMMQDLLSSKANPNARQAKRRSQEQINEMKPYFAGTIPEHATQTLLFQAAAHPNPFTLNCLLNAKADPNSANSHDRCDGWITEKVTPLMHVAMHLPHQWTIIVAQKIKFLIAAKADVNAQDSDGSTALNYLMRVISCFHHEGGPSQSPDYQNAVNDHVLNLLLSRKADCNIANRKEHTPILIAARGCSDTEVRLLLQAKADPNKGKDDYNFTPLMLAIAAIEDPSITMKEDDTVARLLLQAGADVCCISKPIQHMPEGELTIWTPQSLARAAKFEELQKMIEAQLKLKDSNSKS